MNTQRVEMDLGGRVLSIETGRWAKQADGSALIRFGDSVVLVTACGDRRIREGVDFLPLTVDYREYQSAAGRIPGGFFKREGRPTEKEILTCRLIDRPLRPLFPAGWHHETQVIALVLSSDQVNDTDVLALTGASTALYLSDLPFEHPIGGVRVGYVNGRMEINPTYAQLEGSQLDLIVAGTKNAIVMVECGALKVSESLMVEAILFAHEHIKELVAMQERLLQALPARPRRQPKPHVVATEILERVKRRIEPDLRDLLTYPVKKDRDRRLSEYVDSIVSEMEDLDDLGKADARRAFNEHKEHVIRHWILDERRRPDGRAFEGIRNITCEVGVLPRTHGSALFTRGETQALVTATLGTSSDVQKVENLEGEEARRFLLHYNFPPFSVGEVKFMRSPGRREIGHGALASRALEPMLPAEADFPYTVRIVSDILESNGSSSMATVCGGSLALMDAGVPVREAVAGVAMGLVMEGDNYAILTDIAGFEDHYGDMDFKVAGTASGITSLQMDIKTEGVTKEILVEALEQARLGRLHILDVMSRTLKEARSEISAYAPRIITIRIPKDKIRDVIGPGGKVVRSIVERTGAKIDIKDDGTVDIASTDENAAKLARQIIEEIVAEAEVGKTYLGRVQRLADFGAFVEILPGTDGLLHISEISEHRIAQVQDVLEEGQELLVKVISIDPQGRIRLSRKAVLRDQGIVEEAPPQSAPGGGGEGGGDRQGRPPQRNDRDRDRRPPRPRR